MPRLVHFEIHADDQDRAAKFYQAVFGWETKKWPIPGQPDYLAIITGPDSEPGINGGFVQRRGPAPAKGQAVNAYVSTMVVKSLSETAEKAEKVGAQVALPKMAIPGVGWLMYLIDTEGNIFGVMQPDTRAA